MFEEYEKQIYYFDLGSLSLDISYIRKNIVNGVYENSLLILDNIHKLDLRELKYIVTILEGYHNNIKFINPIEIFNLHKNEYIYYKTDHHYTTLGAYYSYLKFCEENIITPLNKDNFLIKRVSNTFLGSLFSKVNLIGITPDEVYIFRSKQKNDLTVDYVTKKSTSLYNFSYLNNARDHYNIFLDNNHPLIKIIKIQIL